MINGLATGAGIIIWTTGIIFGVVAALLASVRVRKEGAYPGRRGWEITAIIVAVLCAYGGIVALVGAVRYGVVSVFLLGATQLTVAIAALAVIRSRFRPMLEGLSAIALGILVVLSGFSIGLFILPFSTLLGAAAVYHADPHTPKSWRHLG